MGNQSSSFGGTSTAGTPVAPASPGGKLIDPAGGELVPSTALDNVWKGDGSGGWSQGPIPPSAPPQATETLLGGGEIATQAETDIGTDDTRLVTPLKLANFSGLGGLPASETVAGIAELATQAEVDAGTDDARIVTPLKLASTNQTFTPTAHAAAHQDGGADEVAVATPAANAIPKAGADSELVAAWLKNFVGDSGGGGAKGAVPAPVAGDAAAEKFLKADGTFQVTPGGGAALSLSWRFDTGTADANPGNRNFRYNNVVQANATFIFFNDTAVGGTDASALLLELKNGDQIFIQESADSTRNQRWSVTGAPTDAGTYVKVPVSNITAGSDLRSNKLCEALLFFTGQAIHALGGSEHSADLLANLNSKISDATLDTSTAPRPPLAHASEHTDGTDDIQDATAAQKGLATATQITKLDGIEALADVTDATNVNAAGAVMETDFNAQTVLVAALDDTPLPVTVAASSFVGRKATGDVGAMTAAEARTVLNVEDGAAADQTDAEIKTAYENNADTNEFSDAEQTKLTGIEASADVTDAANVAAAGAVMDSDISEAEGFLRKTGAGAYEAIKTNIGATTAPGTGNDNTQGYAVGSRWFDTTADKEYVCLDASTGAAVWIETTAGAAGGESNTASNVGTGGVGVFKQKTGVDLEFKKINAGSTKITITDDTANNEVDIDVAAAEETQAGAAEIATQVETDAGTDDTRIVTPKKLAAFSGIGGTPTKELFVPIHNSNDNVGDFLTHNVISNGSLRTAFVVPHDFTSITTLELIGIPDASGSAKDIDLQSDYGAIGELFNNHSESDVTTTYSFTIDVIKAIDLSGLFSSLAAGDHCGLFIDHKSIGLTIGYIAVRLRYT